MSNGHRYRRDSRRAVPLGANGSEINRCRSGYSIGARGGKLDQGIVTGEGWAPRGCGEQNGEATMSRDKAADSDT